MRLLPTTKHYKYGLTDQYALTSIHLLHGLLFPGGLEQNKLLLAVAKLAPGSLPDKNNKEA